MNFFNKEQSVAVSSITDSLNTAELKIRSLKWTFENKEVTCKAFSKDVADYYLKRISRAESILESYNQSSVYPFSKPYIISPSELPFDQSSNSLDMEKLDLLLKNINKYTQKNNHTIDRRYSGKLALSIMASIIAVAAFVCIGVFKGSIYASMNPWLGFIAIVVPVIIISVFMFAAGVTSIFISSQHKNTWDMLKHCPDIHELEDAVKFQLLSDDLQALSKAEEDSVNSLK